jgi:ATP-dependent DNA helicase RecG
MFQSSGLIHADETPVNGMTVADLEVDYFNDFLSQKFGNFPNISSTNLQQLLENMNLFNNGYLNIAGALLFAKSPQYRLPVFIIKAISYPGSVIDESRYLDSNDLTGRLADVFQKGMNFIVNNLSRVQNDRGVNSTGELEIPKEVFEELLVNALIHRDYFVSSPIRLMIFSDRIEIISPGHLPNNLTIENIKNGNSNIRNPILTSFGVNLLPYRGLGSGIIRSLKAYPHIEFVNKRDDNCFKVIITRNQAAKLKNNEVECINFELLTETTETFKEQVIASMKLCKLKQVSDVNAIEMNTKLKELGLSWTSIITNKNCDFIFNGKPSTKCPWKDKSEIFPIVVP